MENLTRNEVLIKIMEDRFFINRRVTFTFKKNTNDFNLNVKFYRNINYSKIQKTYLFLRTITKSQYHIILDTIKDREISFNFISK